VALQAVHEENRQLRRDIDLLKGQNNQLRESVAAAQRYETLLNFKQQSPSQTVAAQVIGRDATNWYRGMILNKGEGDGVRPENGRSHSCWGCRAHRQNQLHVVRRPARHRS
jgi:rod shape-determining protein MreC